MHPAVKVEVTLSDREQINLLDRPVFIYTYSIYPLGNIQSDICILLLNAGHYNGNFPLFGLLCNFLAIPN